MNLLRGRKAPAPKVNETPAEETNGVEPGKDEVSKMTPQQALKSIDKEYFEEEQQEGFDPIRFLLSRDEEIWSLEKVELELSRHEKGLQHINSELAATVMNNYNSFVQGMTKVQEVGNDLTMTSIICKNGRKRLHQAQDNVVKNGLSVVAKYRKRKALISVHHVLNKLKIITDREKQLADLLEGGDFPSAIQLMGVHREDLSAWKTIQCVKQLDQNISSGYEKVAKQIDDGLYGVLSKYDPTSYDRILTAYQLLGQNESAVFGKISNFVQRNADVVSGVVLSFVQKRSKDLESVVKMKFQELCKNVHFDDILPCLLQIFVMLSDMMHNYYQLHLFHKARHEVLGKEISEFRKTLWDLIQKKISQFIGSLEFSHFKIERFLQVHHAVSMFCELGEEFGESDSHMLRGALNAKSKIYIMNSHKDTLEHIRTMVEGFESWSRLDATFSEPVELTQRSTHSATYEEDSTVVRKFLVGDSDSNPFRVAEQNGKWMSERKESDKRDSEEEDEESESYDSSSEDEEQDDDYEDYEDYEESSQYTQLPTVNPQKSPKSPRDKKKKKRKGKLAPVVTNTSNQIVLRMGIYVKAMEIIQADEIFNCFASLYQFYLYIVYALFAFHRPDDEHNTSQQNLGDFIIPENDPNISTELRGALAAVREALNKAASGSLQSTDDIHFQIPKPSEVKTLHSSSRVYGLIERSTAAESLDSLLEVVTKVCNKIKNMIKSSSKQEHVEGFIQIMKKITFDTKQVIYARIVRRIFMKLASTNPNNKGDYPAQIEQCKWVSTRGDQNPYVNNIAKDVETFKNQIEPFIMEEDDKKKVNNQIPKTQIPIQSSDLIWDHVIKFIMMELIEGFSRVKKCTSEGRAQMGIDSNAVQQVILKVSPPSITKPLPYTQPVRNYIQAYYMQNTKDMMEWIRDCYDPIYTPRQLKALIEVGPCAQLPKKQKQDLTLEIDRLYGPEVDPKTQTVNATVATNSPAEKNEFWSLLKKGIEKK